MAAEPPPSVDPGQIERRLAPRPSPQSQPGAFIPAPAQAPAPDRAAAVLFTLQSISIEGNSTFSKEELQPLFKGLLNREISLADVYALRDALTAKYRAAGYVLTEAVIPQQTIEAGSLRLQIVNGAINKINVHGNAGDRLGLIEKYAAKIQSARPLCSADLERYVLLMNDLPGVKVRSVLSASAGAEAGSDLDLFVEESAYDYSLSADNRGTAAVGPYEFSAGANANNLIGLRDQLSVRGVTTSQTRELRYLQLAEKLLLGSEGTSAALSVISSKARPGAAVKSLDLVGSGLSLSLDVSHPLMRTRTRSLSLNTSLKLRDDTVDALGSRISTDRLSIVTAGASLDIADALQGRNLIAVTLAQGLNIFGATETGSPNLSRIDGHSDFTSISFSAEREQPLLDRLAATLSLAGQWSAVPLLSSQQFGIGGAQYGRAFDPSTITGKSGLGLSSELAYKPRLPALLSPLKDLKLYGSIDGGFVNNRGRQSLTSAGGGLRFNTGPVAINLELDQPLRRNGLTDQDLQGFFSASARF